MQDAMNDVQQEGTSVSAAARKFNIPRKTLDDRIKGRVRHGSRPGPSTALTAEDEDALATYLLYMAERGFPLTSNMAMAFAWAIARRSGTQNRFDSELGPGKHWWRSFRTRHPQLTLRTADNLERSRANALNKQVVDNYFETLKVTLETNNLVNTPRQLFNCDETFLPLNISSEKVIARKNAQHVYSQSRGTSEHITLLCGASAAGMALPPMIIFSKAFPGGSYKFDGPDDAVYAKSESGWIDSELFLAWMKKVFLKYCGSPRPVILFVDGHASHVNLDVIDLARENDIILFCLPPHTTHALQPLDVSVFKSLKSHFSKAVRALSFAKKNFVVTKRDFARVVKSPFEQAFSMSNIKAGFTKCGIHPFDPNAIDRSKMMEPLQSSSSSAESDSSGTITDTSLVEHSSDSSQVFSVNPSPIVSSLSPEDHSTHCSSTPLSQTATPAAVSQSVTSSLSSSLQPTTPLCRPPVENPLVRAGLIPTHLADILSPQMENATGKPSHRITGVRVLTSNDYREMIREKERKGKEAAELKQKKKEERERKKLQKEQEREMKKKEREKKKQGNNRKGKEKRCRDSSSSDENEPTSEDKGPSQSRTRTIRPPDRYEGDRARASDSDADSQASNTECIICNAREPPISSSMVFWVDCDQCGEWAHTHCALGSNTATRQFICSSCSA